MFNINDVTAAGGTGPLRRPGSQDPAQAAAEGVAPTAAELTVPAAGPVQDQTQTAPAGETSGYELAATPLVINSGTPGAPADVIPDHIKDYKAPLDPKKLTADDMNRFNLVQQIFQMKTESASAIANETNHDTSAKATAQSKKADAPKKKKGGFFSKLKNLVMKILPVLTLITMFVPGLQVLSMALKVAQMAMKAIQMIEALKNGDWKAALGSIAGMAASFGGPIGEIAKWGSKGMEVLNAVEKGGLAGGLSAMGGLVGGEVGGYLNTAAKAVTAIESGDPMAMLDAVGGDALKGLVDEKTMGMLKDAVGVANGIVKGDAAAALASLGSAAGAAGIEGADTLKSIGSVVDAYNSGDVSKLYDAVKGTGVLPDGITKTLDGAVPQAMAAYKAFESGDLGEIMRVAGDAMPEDFKKTITEAFNSENLNQVDDLLGLNTATPSGGAVTA